jgi:carboxypeptidase Taq
MLSPNESLGLAGTALEGRVRRAANHMSDSALARIAERLQTDAKANEMIYERDGIQDSIRIMLRPLVAMPEQLSYVHNVCLRLTEALKRLPTLYLEDPALRRILAITPDEERWLRDTWTARHRYLSPIYGRLGAVCDFTGAGWQDSLHFMEPNLSGVGGIYYAPLAEQLVASDVVPTLLAHDPGLAIELPRDQRDLFVQVLIDHARALGRNTCHLCFVEPKDVHDGPYEQSVLSRFLAKRHGLTIVHADPRELRCVGDEVFHGDVRIDVVYRDYELRELIALECELGRRLDSMRLLFHQNRVVSSLVGDFDHKSCWELLTDASIAERLFSGEECRLFRRHVLWTRVVGDRRTTLPNNREGDLLEYARLHRDQLVLKPNRGYGGKGVTLGAGVDVGEWETMLHEAVSKADDPERSWVLQAATRLPVHEFPVVGPDRRVYGEPFYAVMGFAATENGLGTLCRVSQKQVVNVAQYGGMAAVLIARAPSSLRMPKRAASRAESLDRSLRAQIAELRHLDQTVGLLGWDEETMLPAAGRAQRGEQLATIEGLRHTLLVSDRLGDLVEDVAAQYEGDERWTRELALLRRLRRIAIALPEDLVRAFAAAKSHALGAWEEARISGTFAGFAPSLERVLALVRERAQALTPGSERYDGLLDEHEPGMTRARLDPVLAELRRRLVPLLRRAGNGNGDPATALRGRRFPESAQWELCRRLLTAIGFEFDRGRIDRSSHPFTLWAGADDVRMTLRMNESDLTTAVLATLHEGGHGLYDQGFLAADRDSLLGDAPSMGMHEAQARLWENHVGRSRAFWRYWFAEIRDLFPDAAVGLNGEAFHRAVNFRRPTAIRVGADEVSYHLHILLRYELELALLAGDLAVGDLPTAWNEKSAALIGARPTSDRDGVLQDVHWSLGMFGYFPTYTLGSLYAAQLAETYGRDRPMEDEIGRGEFGGLLAWLRQHVHRPGHRHSADDIVGRATGKGLDADAFLRHIETGTVDAED